MIARTGEAYGVEHLGIGSDLCQDQPDAIVTWMRQGRWTKGEDFGEGSADQPGFPPQPSWFQNNADFPNLEIGLQKVGFSQSEIAGLMGENWLRFYDAGFTPA